MIEVKAKGTVKESVVKEISVSQRGFKYIVIYGKCEQGNFCAIPNFRCSALLSSFDDVRYNVDKITDVINDKMAGKAIATAIAENEKITEGLG